MVILLQAKPTTALVAIIFSMFFANYPLYGQDRSLKQRVTDDYERVKSRILLGDYDMDESLASSRIQDWKKAAELNLPEAQFLVGVCMDQGKGMKKDERGAFKLYESSATSGCVCAQRLISDAYIDGHGSGVVDSKKRICWLREAASKGFTPAQVLLGSALLYGGPDVENHKEGFEWYLKAAEEGSQRGQQALAFYYLENADSRKDVNEAKKWMSRADGNPSLHRSYKSIRYNALGVRMPMLHKQNGEYIGTAPQLIRKFRDCMDLEWVDGHCKAVSILSARAYSLYSVGYNLSQNSELSIQDKASIAKDAFLAGLLQDDERAGNVIADVLQIAAKQQISNKILDEARTQHLQIWNELLPLCQEVAGASTNTSPFRFEVEYDARSTQCLFKVVNVSGKDLSNVTLLTDNKIPGVSAIANRMHVIFVVNWKDKEVIELPSGLIPPPRRSFDYRIGATNCLTYSVWCSKFKVEKEFLSLPKNVRMKPSKSDVYNFQFLLN